MKALLESQKNTKRIILMISHRLGTVANADKIFVMRDGIVVESGTPSELIECKGVYWDLLQCHQDDGANEPEEEEESSDKIPEISSSDDPSSSEVDIKAELKSRMSTDAPRIAPKGKPYKPLQVLRRCFQMSRPELTYILLGSFCKSFSHSLPC